MFFKPMITEVADSLAEETVQAADSVATVVNEIATTVQSVASGEMSVVELLQSSGDLDFSALITNISGEIMKVGFKIVIALMIYYIGRFLIRKMISFMDKGFEARDVEVSLRSFLKSMVNIVLYVLLILTIIQLLGINTTSLVAMLASAGLAIGMALSGTLQNFAGGVMILFLKPYKVGDYIIAQGQAGTVQEIMLFTTVLETFNGDTIFVPNSTISSSIIENYSHSGERRIVWTVSVSYGDDYDQVKAAIMDILLADERIINDPNRPTFQPSVVLSKLADSSVDLDARVWVTNENYWGVMFDVNEQIYKQLPTKGANFPFPQMDVHIKNS
ncbi:MAG: mechanosensitive ion channel family protein [Rikenellaceae bacterium]